MNEKQNNSDSRFTSGSLDNLMGREDQLDANDILVERLVNNEISTADRKALLAEAGHDQSLWRTIALAFIENQILTDSFHDVEQTKPEIAASRYAVNLPQENCALEAEVDSENKIDSIAVDFDQPGATQLSADTKLNVTPLPSPARLPGWAIAATVLVAVFGGFLMGKLWPLNKSEPSMITANSGSAKDHLTEDAADLPLQQVAHSMLEYADPVTGKTTRVPMLDAEVAKKKLLESVDDEVKLALHQEGYTLVPVTTFVRGRLADDREFIFPLHRLRVTSFVQ